MVISALMLSEVRLGVEISLMLAIGCSLES